MVDHTFAAIALMVQGRGRGGGERACEWRARAVLSRQPTTAAEGKLDRKRHARERGEKRVWRKQNRRKQTEKDGIR
jgi:hypothetical protein